MNGGSFMSLHFHRSGSLSNCRRRSYGVSRYLNKPNTPERQSVSRIVLRFFNDRDIMHYIRRPMITDRFFYFLYTLCFPLSGVVRVFIQITVARGSSVLSHESCHGHYIRIVGGGAIENPMLTKINTISL